MRAKILNASAGSGKTYRLTYNYIRDVLWQPMLYRHILAVTFTNKATEEMKSRILKQIHKLAEGKESPYMQDLRKELLLSEEEIRQRAARVQSAILHDYSHFTILTIDKFFQRILHAFIRELGIELNYNIELESAPVLSRSVDALIEQISVNPELKRWLTDFARERMEESTAWDLRNDIRKLGGELFKEGARAALERPHSKEELEQIIKKAGEERNRSMEEFKAMAGEAVEIITRSGLGLEDFSNKRSGGCAYFYKVANGSTDEPSKRARTCAETTDKEWMPKDRTKHHTALLEVLHERMAALCQFYDDHIIGWNTTLLLKEYFRSFALLSDLFTQVKQVWREENTLLLSETKNILAAFIEENDTPFIYEKVGNRFDRYFIDEFQDTSSREWSNFLPLLLDSMARPSQLSTPDMPEKGMPVLLVGDVKQSIYRWRGGDWRILGGEAKQALGDAHVEPMNENYRSFRRIVSFNNDAMAAVVNAISKKMSVQLEASKLPSVLQEELSKMLSNAYSDVEQEVKKSSIHEGYVSVETFHTAPPLVERICLLLEKGYRPCDLMILVRSARDGEKAARALLDFKRQNHDKRYHFDIMTQDALRIDSSPLCNFLIALLYLSIDPEQSIRRAIYNHYLGRAFDAPIDPEEQLWLRRLRLIPPEEAFEQIVMRYRLDQDAGQVAYLQALHQQILRFSNGRVADIPLFLEWWEEQGHDNSLVVEESLNTIEITTIHRAKGLEKKVILIPYCSWSLDPKSTGETPNILWSTPRGELEKLGQVPVKYRKEMAGSLFSEAYYREWVYSHVDNVNLLYVALTRAVEQLHIFIPDSRSGIGEYLWSMIVKEGDKAQIGSNSGSYKQSEEGEQCYFGLFEGPEPEKSQSTEEQDEDPTPRHVTLDSYPTVRPEPSLKYPTASYEEHGGEAEFSPRNFGILMHRLFEEAATRSEVEEALERMRQEALLSADDAELLAGRVNEVLSDPVAASWYEEKWDRVMRERDIILPANEKSNLKRKRPDRVMVKGERAVVVDYKFGEKDPEGYRRQIVLYTELLKKMGFTQVEGWLWYVRLGRTERVI